MRCGCSDISNYVLKTKCGLIWYAPAECIMILQVSGINLLGIKQQQVTHFRESNCCSRYLNRRLMLIPTCCQIIRVINFNVSYISKRQDTLTSDSGLDVKPLLLKKRLLFVCQ